MDLITTLPKDLLIDILAESVQNDFNDNLYLDTFSAVRLVCKEFKFLVDHLISPFPFFKQPPEIRRSILELLQEKYNEKYSSLLTKRKFILQLQQFNSLSILEQPEICVVKEVGNQLSIEDASYFRSLFLPFLKTKLSVTDIEIRHEEGGETELEPARIVPLDFSNLKTIYFKEKSSEYLDELIHCAQVLPFKPIEVELSADVIPDFFSLFQYGIRINSFFIKFLPDFYQFDSRVLERIENLEWHFQEQDHLGYLEGLKRLKNLKSIKIFKSDFNDWIYPKSLFDILAENFQQLKYLELKIPYKTKFKDLKRLLKKLMNNLNHEITVYLHFKGFIDTKKTWTHALNNLILKNEAIGMISFKLHYYYDEQSFGLPYPYKHKFGSKVYSAMEFINDPYIQRFGLFLK